MSVGGRLSVILHKSENHEGGPGLRLYHTFSDDGGKIWSALSPIEGAWNGVKDVDRVGRRGW